MLDLIRHTSIHSSSLLYSDAIGIKLSVIADSYTYLCYTDKKSPIF